MPQSSSARRGVAASLLASVLFAGIFSLAALVSSSAEVLFGWRVLVTLACYLLALAFPPVRRLVVQLWRRLRSRWWMPLLALLLAAIVGLQLWLFMWAPRHGHGLDASLGFLLLPITLVLAGRFLLGQRVSRLRWLIVALAGVAVLVKVVATPELSWVTLAICLPYPGYFVLRQRFGLDTPVAFGFETLLLAPVALIALMAGATPESGGEWGVLLAIGLGSTIAMVLYMAASSGLSMAAFGLLSYVEPVLLVGVALALGERLHDADLVVYAILAVALTLLALDGFRAARQRH